MWVDLSGLDYDTYHCKAIHARQTNSAIKAQDYERFHRFRCNTEG